MTRLCILPSLESISPESGIGRIVHAQYKYLPPLGFEMTGPDQAEVIIGHTQMFGLPRIDCLHCHGVYWTGDPGSGQYLPWHTQANQKIVEATRRARIITVPSDWVAEPFRRDMRLTPRIIPHGLELAEWSVLGEPKGFVLWNKNRAGDVCDPAPALQLAAAGVPVISTFAPPGLVPPENFRTVGVLSQPRMKELLQNATAYLATTRETYGIGTLEALACGVPVLGFRWGGTSELVQHQINGYLVEPGNIQGLREGWEYIQAHWAALSEAAHASVIHCDWSERILPYADLFRELAGEPQTAGKIAVIIPCYNYGRYVAEAIESVLAQTRPASEIVVVDDGSTDDSLKVLEHYAGRIKIIAQSNQGVAAARNHGIVETHSPYIVCLDADDRLDPRYLEATASALDADRGLGVAYTGLFLLSESGQLSPNPWPPEFSWETMTTPGVPPSSCIHTAAMFRRSLWERAGGYKQEYAPAEDTEFWVRGLANGFTAARVTEEGLFHYRPHAESALRSKTFVPIDLFHPWMRDKKYPFAAPVRAMPLVRSYGDPLVSVVLTSDRTETDGLIRAIDSILGQTLREWELILVGDLHVTGDNPTPYPFLKQIILEKFSLTKARNAGAEKARAPLILFLKASEWLKPEALALMVKTYGEQGGRYIYTDWFTREARSVSAPEYDPRAALKGMEHLSAVLLSSAEARTIKFDETRKRSEAEFFAHLAVAGIHGYALHQPLIFSENVPPPGKKVLAGYQPYAIGEKEMAGCCGGSSGEAVVAAKKLGLLMESPPAAPPEMPVSVGPGVVRLEFVGPQRGSQSFGGAGRTPSGQSYLGGNNAFDKYKDVDPRDVEWLENTLLWKRVASIPAPLAPAPSLPPQVIYENLLDRIVQKVTA